MYKRTKPKYVKSDKKWQLDYRALPPIKDPRENRNGWLPKRPSGDTKEEMEELDILVEIALQNRDTNLSTDQRSEYIKAQTKLKDAGITKSILEIVEEYIELNPKKVTKTVGECYAEWRAVQEERVAKGSIEKETAKYSLRGKPALEPYFDKNISIFNNSEVAKELAASTRKLWSKLSAESLRKAFKTNSQFFKWCVGMEYLIKQPLTEILTVVEDSNRNVPPEVLKPDELAKLLHTAQRTDGELGLLSYYVIHCLVGVRPKEVKRLSWDKIKLDDPDDCFIHLGKTKTKQPRKIDLSSEPLTVEWLRMCDRSKPIYPPNYNKRRKALLVEAGLIEKGGSSKRFQNIGRHSCATYLFELGVRESEIKKRCGNSESVLERFYFNSEATKAEARDYFAVAPIKNDEKLVSFGG
jgi:integrase